MASQLEKAGKLDDWAEKASFSVQQSEYLWRFEWVHSVLDALR
jgi:hypothetical protein